MSHSQLPTPNEPQNGSQVSRPDPSRQQQTEPDVRSTPLQHAEFSMRRTNTGRSSNMQVRPAPGRHTTSRRPLQRNSTTRTNRTNRTNHSSGLYDAYERSERRQEPIIDVEDDYFTLNPWHNQQKAQPVFGMAAPLPRTVRKGMWWGRGDLKKSLYKVDEGQDDGVDRHDALDYGKDIEDIDVDSDETKVSPHCDQGGDPEVIRTTIDGRQVNMRRVPTTEANQMQNPATQPYRQNSNPPRQLSRANTNASNRAPINEHGLAYHDNNEDNHRQFGLADGLPPLQELTSHSDTQSEQEEKHIQQRDHAAEQAYYNQYRNPLARLRAQYPQAPAEFLATFIYLFLGISVNLSLATSTSAPPNPVETQAWGWAFALMTGVYIGGGISGAHLSPTISLSLTIYRGFPPRLALLYAAAQMLAGLAAGALAYALYRDAIRAVDPNLTQATATALFPRGPAYSHASAFANDFVAMAVWTCTAFALGDDQNSPPTRGMSPLVFGLSGAGGMLALGCNTGLGISPARDLGPRVLGWCVGYRDAFADAYWAYGPWGAGVAGALVGGLVYDVFCFAGGESPVNFRWCGRGEGKKVRDRILRVA